MKSARPRSRELEQFVAALRIAAKRSARADYFQRAQGRILRRRRSARSCIARSQAHARRASGSAGVRDFLERIHRVMNAIDAAPLTTIAAVHGVTFGGGFELALTCDLIVADKMARFCFPELRLGLIPGFGGIPRLKRDLGNAVVRDLLLTGRSINATKAQAVGLVSQVTAEGDALRVARATAAQLAKFDRETAARREALHQADPARRVAARDRYLLRSVHAAGGRSRAAQVRREHRRAAVFAVDCVRRSASPTRDMTRECGKIRAYDDTRKNNRRNPAARRRRISKCRASSSSPDDDFFKKLGINSLQALDLLTRIEQHFHIELPDYELQGVSDFRTLAERIQSRL